MDQIFEVSLNKHWNALQEWVCQELGCVPSDLESTLFSVWMSKLENLRWKQILLVKDLLDRKVKVGDCFIRQIVNFTDLFCLLLCEQLAIASFVPRLIYPIDQLTDRVNTLQVLLENLGLIRRYSEEIASFLRPEFCFVSQLSVVN